ncbi:MAG: histidinol dehydrogenase, partial [Gammaproteobacteria bacterium]|nr:histidinol dehydrogenase [Gammaproteobacteria bacterium]
MSVEFLKRAIKTPQTGEDDTRKIVTDMLDDIEQGGEDRVRHYAKELDGWNGEIVVSRDTIDAAAEQVPQQMKDDIQ